MLHSQHKCKGVIQAVYAVQFRFLQILGKISPKFIFCLHDDNIAVINKYNHK